jgi:hypothetical protein
MVLLTEVKTLSNDLRFPALAEELTQNVFGGG